VIKKILFILSALFMVQVNTAFATTIDKKTSTFPPETSAMQERLQAINIVKTHPFTITFYRPTYVLPFYYTASPDAFIYRGNTPDNQGIMHSELKAQLSLMVPVVSHVMNTNTSLNIAYTQLSYWQVYASSQYFRETNYEPEIFLSRNFLPNWLVNLGLDHQSNGRGGALERSWNRMILSNIISDENWIAGIQVWSLIFRDKSSNLHNPDIAHYLGYESLLFSYKFHQITASIQLQNLESLLRRGSTKISLSYPLNKNFSLYTQYFNGYGQSLIEYNNRTQSFGIGIALNDWI